MKKITLLSAVFYIGFIFNFTKAQTTLILQPGPDEGKDAAVWTLGTENHGDRESLTAYTWTQGGERINKRAFLAFDYSAIPEDVTILSAKLSLFYNPTDPIESWDYHSGENDMFIQRVTSAWEEHTIVWENQPSTTAEHQVELPPSTIPTQDYPDIDVTDLVIDMTGPSAENNGFMIRMADEINYYKGVLFASSDHTNSALHPTLTIVYELGNSVQEGEPAFIYKLFPNPATRTVTVELGADIDVSLELINAQGQLVRKIKSIHSPEIIDVSSLMAGTYIVRLLNNDFVATKKLVIN
jgi:hypothetical protein